MSVKAISTVTFSVDQNSDISVEKISSSSKKLQASNIVADTLKSLNLKEGNYTFEVFKDRITQYYNPLGVKPLTIVSYKNDSPTIEKITDAFKRQLRTQWIFNKTIEKPLKGNVGKIDKNPSLITSNESSKNILKNAFKSFLNGLDFIFVQKLWHAKGADIVVLSLFAFTILATALTIFAPHLSILHFANTAASASHPAFGVLNITVGMAIFVQAYKNFMKAKKNENKEEMILAIVSMLFSFAIMATGATAIANSSNDILLKSLFTICASFSFGVGVYNTTKTQLFRKKLNAKKLKEFLKEQLEISNKEYEIIDRKIKALNDEKEIAKLLKNHLSTKEYLEAISKDKKFQKDLLLNLELQALQRRKIANVEKILRSKITKRAIDYVKGVEDKDLLADIKKELNHRNIADALRIVATSLSIGAFGFNTLSKIENLNVQNLIYYSTMMVSKLSGFWQNYVPSWRNVPADDKKDLKKRKTILEHMDKREKEIQALANDTLLTTV